MTREQVDASLRGDDFIKHTSRKRSVGRAAQQHSHTLEVVCRKDEWHQERLLPSGRGSPLASAPPAKTGPAGMPLGLVVLPRPPMHCVPTKEHNQFFVLQRFSPVKIASTQYDE